jgi:hypothetical protein
MQVCLPPLKEVAIVAEMGEYDPEIVDNKE